MESGTPNDIYLRKARSIIDYCAEAVKVRKTNDEIEGSVKDVIGGEIKNWSANISKKLKLFNDPIHGSILLNPLECAIINTPEFYRLRDIKQLGGKSHVYPGAVHTRFEHSIGVCHLAGEFVKHLRQPYHDCLTPSSEGELEEIITTEEEQCICIAGLCHDLGHGPFSHIFDKVKKEIMKDVPEIQKKSHEAISVLMFKKILLEHPKVLCKFVIRNLEWHHVKMIGDMIDCSLKFMEDLEKGDDKRKVYLYEIVANKVSGLDVDKWDYFARDCYFLGVKNEFDVKRCIALSKIIEYSSGSRHIAFRDKEYQNIYGMFRTRCMIHQKAVSHKKVSAIEMMLKDAMVKAKGLKLFANQQTLEDALNLLYCEPADLSGYIKLSDNILYRILEHCKSEGDPVSEATSIANRIIDRDTYSLVCDVEGKPLHDGEIIIPGKEVPELTKDKRIKISEMDGKKFKYYEINRASISYASENKDDPDPVKAVHFYSKDDEHSQELVRIRKDRLRLPDSQVTTPKSFIECRVRLFRKHQDKSQDQEALKWFYKQFDVVKQVA